MEGEASEGQGAGHNTGHSTGHVMGKSIGKGLGKGKFVGGKGPKRYRLGPILQDGKQIRKPTLRRLARRGGIKRISADYYDEIRGILVAKLTNVLTYALVYCKSAKRSTLFPSDVLFALKRINEPLYGFD